THRRLRVTPPAPSREPPEERRSETPRVATCSGEPPPDGRVRTSTETAPARQSAHSRGPPGEPLRPPRDRAGSSPSETSLRDRLSPPPDIPADVCGRSPPGQPTLQNAGDHEPPPAIHDPRRHPTPPRQS